MRFALIGTHPDALDLADAVVQSPDHHLQAVYDAPHAAEQLRSRFRGALWDRPWEECLVGGDCEAVIVSPAGGSEEKLDRLRKLTQSGLPLLLVHPGCESIAGYELMMIQQDTSAVLTPYVPGLHHPAVRRMAELASHDSGPIGGIEQTVFERSLPHRDRARVVAQLARDAAFIRSILGRIRKVSAMSAGSEVEAYANLSVNFAVDDDRLVRWSLSPADEVPHGRLTLLGTRGRAVLEMPEDPAAWTLTIRRSEGEPRTESHADYADCRRAIDNFAAEVDQLGEDQWSGACRDIEVAESVGRSMQRGRTVEIYDDKYTEEDVFRGAMSIAGCGMLLMILLILGVMALADGVGVPALQQVLRYLWPILAGVLLAFLALQFLKPNFSGRERGKEGSESEEIRKSEG